MTDVLRAPAVLRRPRTALTAAVVAVLALFDAVTVTPGWAWPVLGLPALLAAAARRSTRRGDRPHGEALAVAAVATSLAGTALLAAVPYRWAGSWGMAETAVLLLLLVARWQRASGPREWALTGAVGLAAVLQPLRLLGPDSPALLGLTSTATAAAAAVAVGLRGQTARRALAVAAARREERVEIARDLHDVVAHHVTGVLLAARAARTLTTGREQAPARGTDGAAARGVPPAAVVAALADIEAAASEALGSMRRLVGVLRTDPADGATRSPAPGLGDVPALVQRFRDAGAAERVELTVSGDTAAAPPEVAAGLYRVVQEGLTNCARHARGAARVDVVLDSTPSAAVVEVVDSGGRGNDDDRPPAGGGVGLVGMAERLAALGGSLTAGPGPGGGWAVRAVVPLAAAADGGQR